jgi:hypothetical protein
MELDALVGKYAWVNAIEGWTVSVMRRRVIDDVVQVFGRGMAVSMGDVTFTELDRLRGPDPARVELFVQLLTRDDYTVTLEHNGWSGSLPEIARRCSADDGWFFSVCWNLHAAGMTTQAVDGAITASFESVFPIEPGPRGGDLRPEWAIGPAIESSLTWQVCMAHLEHQTGVEIEQRWLHEPYPTYRIPEPHWLYRDVDGADRP